MTAHPRKRVLIIHTGGTLGMAADEGARERLQPGELLERILLRVPELSQIAHVDLISPWNMDSSDLWPTDWSRLAQLICREGGIGQRGAGYDGVVVIHGTDTMAYTACALAFMLENLDRPVVLTGSQRSLEAWRSDARANLTSAVETATLDVPEVMIVFGDVILRGCRASKTDANSYRAFETPLTEPLGIIGTDLSMSWHEVRRPRGPFALRTGIEPGVVAMTLFPGLSPRLVRQALLGGAEPVRAVVLRAFGVGNVPIEGDGSLLELLHALSREGIPLVVTSQCLRGHTRLTLYPAGRHLLDAGVIEARDMTFEATVVKAMWALAQPGRSLREWFATDLAGEVSP